MALIVKMPILALLGLFFGPWKAQILETPCAQVGTEVSAHCGIRKKPIEE